MPATADTAVLFREVMARFPSGVTIVTTTDGPRPVGFTASSFCSVSAQPPLVLVCLARKANCYPVFAHADRFAVSILATGQGALASRFASKNGDKFGAGGFVPTARGGLVVADCVAALECTVHDRRPAGDHLIMVGAVEQLCAPSELPPAVYCDRRFAALV
ncbi:flavin reductase family protein [Nocardia suismassiliense]|uniref:flavin reductase family protein n=1 Tax=Nocardia suismassiliense TaxID=2077092 RepID=UPI000D1E1908|nr:flavin reductase family protein [Nocardia suismassiliense]